ncbi:hypothetical protein BH10PSE7_BH10PSE7_05280 [soil metagenome]
MRDYALTQSQNRVQAEEFGILGRLFRNWQSRRRVASLQELDDYLLDDIGVTREDIKWASATPLNENATLLLEDRASRRQRGFLHDGL